MSPSLRHFSLNFGLVLGVTVAGSGTALAAPQVLGLVATNGTVEPICHGSRCGAEFAAFCLQGQHDGFLNFLNSQYWDAIDTGS
jgi:hypothetical protein